MLNQYEPNVKATIAYLKCLNVKVNNTTVNETLQNHPDWPSLLCITDSLSKWNIPSAAGKIDIDTLSELPTPFISHMRDKESPLAIVTEVTATTINLYQKTYKSPITISKEDFVKSWDGIYVIAEPNENSGEENYATNKQKTFYKSFIKATALTAILALTLILLKKSVDVSSNNNRSIYLQYIILSVGVAITSLLLWYEIDRNNPLLHKVCTGIAKGNCNAILTGKQSKVFNWLSWSEVGFFYFTGALLTLLFVPNSISFVAWLNILALPYTIFSIYYQWKVANQWCVLCLAVQVILLLGGANVIVNNSLHQPVVFNYSFLAFGLLLFLLPPLIWYALKPYILRLQEAKNTRREFLRIKFNTEIFDALLKKQKQITLPADGIGIDIGNPAATNTIIKVCNPYCGPCANAHSKIEALVEQNNNVNAKIIFTTANKENNPAIKPVRHLLAIAAEHNPGKTKQALDDWYLANTKDYEIFATKYEMNGELEKQGHKIEQMEMWCKVMGVTATPTIFINGQQIPDMYSIEDLQYFLQE